MFHREYPNAYHTRDVTNSEKHPRIDEITPETGLPLCEISQKCLKPYDGNEGSESLLLKAIVKMERINWNGETDARDRRNSVSCYPIKKRRMTEQEKLIASLCKSELGHVDGAFKRSTTTQYKNLNEDKLLNNLFDVRKAKAKNEVVEVIVKKKRKTEKEKLIESLTEIEKIHAEGAFKRNVAPPPNVCKVDIDNMRVGKFIVRQLSDAT